MTTKNIFAGVGVRTTFVNILYDELMKREFVTLADVMCIKRGKPKGFYDNNPKATLSREIFYGDLKKASSEVVKALEQASPGCIEDNGKTGKGKAFRYIGENNDPLVAERQAIEQKRIEDYVAFCKASAGILPSSWFSSYFENTQLLLDTNREAESGDVSGSGEFETFWPRMIHPRNPHRWAYDAVVYYEVEQALKKPFYVIKESLGGTAIDTTCQSTNKMYWSANPDYLASTAAADKGGKSLLKAFTDNIGACIDKQLSQLKGGYDIRVMLWHQGESDRKAPWRYYGNLKAVVSYVRNYLVRKTGDQSYAQLPVVCGTYSEKSRGYKKEIVDALYRLQQEDPNFHVVDVSDATLREDKIHFDATGAELLGMRMYNKLLEIGVIK